MIQGTPEMQGPCNMPGVIDFYCVRFNIITVKSHYAKHMNYAMGGCPVWACGPLMTNSYTRP